MNKENLDLKSRVEEMEEDEAEVLKKYKTAVQQVGGGGSCVEWWLCRVVVVWSGGCVG